MFLGWAEILFFFFFLFNFSEKEKENALAYLVSVCNVAITEVDEHERINIKT